MKGDAPPRRRLLAFLLGGTAAVLAASAVGLAPARETPAPFPETPPTPPVTAPALFRALDGFRMVIIAAEPAVTDPVAIAYDEFGRAYVAEMNDYPYTDKAAHKPSQENPTDAPIGKIRLLEDSDGDGLMDRSTVFADQLSWPTGVACWKGGVYVIATPNLWYFKDTDGEGKADIRRKVYTGFRKLNVQAVVNNPVWGLDHRIYISGSTNGGDLRKVDDPEAPPLRMSRHDLRFDPVTESLELETGYGRFGNSFDDFGNRFICNIRTPALHVVIPARYLNANPHLPPQQGLQDIGQFGEFLAVHRISPPEAWRVERAERWMREEPDRHPKTELVGGGAVTSSAGVTIYRGDAYPTKYHGQLFVADVSSNLFYRLALKPSGVTFEASRIDLAADFVASEDVWFRPVNLVNAPDGCLHVLDMYREAIEHPWSIPDDIHARIDLERGRDRGRIYRLEPPGFQLRPVTRLGDLPSTELVAFLRHPNAWHRETAHRLLFERQDPAAVKPLAELLLRGELPAARIHALYLLSGLGALRADDLEEAWTANAAFPQVLEHLLRVAESLAPGDDAIRRLIVNALDDPDLRVRFQAVLALPSIDPAAVPAGKLRQLAREHGGDPWFRTAILCSTADVAGDLLESLLLDVEAGSVSRSLLLDLAHTVGAKNDPAEVPAVIRTLAENRDLITAESRVAAAAGLAEGLDRKRLNLFAVAAKSPKASGFREGLLADARAVVASSSRPADLRAAALSLFRSTPFAEASTVYAETLSPEVPPELQNTAIRSLSAFAEPTVAAILLDAWPRLSPGVQQQALDALFARPERLGPLLDAMTNGVVSPHLVTKARRDLLVAHPDAAVSARAKVLFATDTRPREEVIARYRNALDKFAGAPDAGEKIFQSVCAACHRSGETGLSDLGPNLSTVRQWDREQLLVNILDPNREVSPAFIEYVIETNDAGIVSGAVLNETDAAVLLRLPDGTRQAVYRRDIRTIRNTGFSLMPEGLEAVITPEQMADLIAYLTRP